MKGLDILIFIDNKPVAAQTSCHLNRQTRTADIGDKIALDWDDYAIGAKGWSINCSGVYVVNDAALESLEDAWFNGNPVDIQLKKDGVLSFSGQAIITYFPITAPFNMDFTYSLTLQGKGELTRV